ncbi:MAG: single-stranded DNA-binding protein [Candidatus Tectomicrobia bacterium]|uniref:Single-stranded DNA-binding protein n=1 Tax=Tectimicrobiota bacterium TaxID=2528274 RepID=A0A933LRK8_UNCTE|nr:single-stranded DNA-binding protein [Candidatus Tectomicrobia bacterium]
MSLLFVFTNRVANFSPAVNKFYTDKAGEKQKHTYWFRVTAFSRLAEICGEYLKTGVKVVVRGQLISRNWEDSEGNKHSTVEIRARELELLGNGNGHGPHNGSPDMEDNSDIPF